MGGKEVASLKTSAKKSWNCQIKSKKIHFMHLMCVLRLLKTGFYKDKFAEMCLKFTLCGCKNVKNRILLLSVDVSCCSSSRDDPLFTFMLSLVQAGVGVDALKHRDSTRAVCPHTSQAGAKEKPQRFLRSVFNVERYISYGNTGMQSRTVW